jgi:uncharacterized RDD family membrane protein YckC
MADGVPPHAYAGFVSRAVAFVVDLIVISVAILLVIAFAQAMLSFFTLYGVFGHSATISGPVRNVMTAVITLISVVIAVGYPVGCWTLLGQTLGKALTGVRVVRLDNSRLTVWRALLRYAGYWLSALPLFLGFFWVLGDQRRRAWHDRLAGTCVVYTFQQATAPPNASSASATPEAGREGRRRSDSVSEQAGAFDLRKRDPRLPSSPPSLPAT